MSASQGRKFLSRKSQVKSLFVIWETAIKLLCFCKQHCTTPNRITERKSEWHNRRR